MIANLAMGMLLVGSGRIIVQLCGNIEDFAIYSFGMSVTGLVLTAVTAFSLVLYPMIKRISEDKYYYLFKRINIFTRSFGLPAILVYFPACWFITFFYPKYDSVLPFLNFLFAIVFLQCKISILNNTYYKVLRKEKPMLTCKHELRIDIHGACYCLLRNISGNMAHCRLYFRSHVH